MLLRGRLVLCVFTGSVALWESTADSDTLTLEDCESVDGNTCSFSALQREAMYTSSINTNKADPNDKVRSEPWFCAQYPFFVADPLSGRNIVQACPEGSGAITSPQACEAAAAKLGLNWTEKVFHEAGANQAGCVAWQTGATDFKNVVFNNIGNDAASNQRPICKRCVNRRYATGTPTCTAGMVQIMDAARCQEAAYRSGASPTANQNIAAYPNGCIDVKGWVVLNENPSDPTVPVIETGAKEVCELIGDTSAQTKLCRMHWNCGCPGSSSWREDCTDQASKMTEWCQSEDRCTSSCKGLWC